MLYQLQNSEIVDDLDVGLELFIKETKCQIPNKIDLELYLREKVHKTFESKFDRLNWWHDDTSRYPIFATMIHDILIVPLSSVAFESIFCTGKGVIDAYQNCLTSNCVEALIRGQDWLKSDEGNFHYYFFNNY